MVQDFTQFEAWKKAMALAVQIHAKTTVFPKEETYGVVSQMRRAGISIPANIAEGFGRYTYPDKKHKYVQARGELIELMTFLYYGQKVGYISASDLALCIAQCEELHKMINGLIKSMRSDVPIP